jgi:hypothetical protein
MHDKSAVRIVGVAGGNQVALAEDQFHADSSSLQADLVQRFEAL